VIKTRDGNRQRTTDRHLAYRDTDRADHAQAVSHLILLQSSLIASFTATQLQIMLST